MTTSSSPTNSPAADRRGWLASALRGPWPAVLLGIVCFLNTLPNGFTYDDNAIVRTNPRIRSLTNFHDIWLTDWWFQPAPDEPVVNPSRDRLYRPLTLYSFAINYAVGGLDPLGYHLVNVILHALTCGLVWFFARRLLRDDALAALAAVIFAVHPVHCEAVAGIVGRGEILAALFLLAGLLAILPRSGPPSPARVGVASLLFLAALLAKETAVCYPAIALIAWHALYGRRGLPLRRWAARTGVLLAPLVVYFPLRWVALGEHIVRDRMHGILFTPLVDAGWWPRLHGPFTILGHYARLLLVPRTLSSDYGLAVFDPRHGPEAMTLVGLLAAIALLTALAGYGKHRGALWRHLAILSAMFIASYALISNTVLLIGVSVAERLMYWPSVPVLIAVATLVIAFWQRYCTPGGTLHERTGLLRGLGLALLVALALRSVVRNMDWRNDETLFRTDLRAFPQSAQMNNALARIDLWHASHETDPDRRTRWLDEATVLLERALRVEPRYAGALLELGTAYAMRGDVAQARKVLGRALMLAPANKRAQLLLAQLRGTARADRARVAKLRQQIQQDPNNADLHRELGQTLIKLGDNYAALQEFERAVQLAPNDAATLRGYGEALALNYQEAKAIDVFRKVVKLDPEDWQAHGNLCKLLADRDPAAALRHAQIAYKLHPDDVRTQSNLAEALAANGRIAEALEHLRQIERGLPPGDPFRKAVQDRIRELQARLP